MAVSIICATASAHEPCQIKIVDRQDGWPVPLVELRTTHNVRFVSDNSGVIAFDLHELMGIETWFSIEGHGYGVPPDGFGYRGVRLTPQPGQELEVKVDRELPARRLGRITGGGLFGESQQCGLETDWREQGVLGCDSVQTALYNDRLVWAWGDTTLAGYPLGIFHTLGARTDPSPLQSLQPPIRLRYDYFRDDAGQPRAIGRMPGNGPTWISGLASLPDRRGRQRLVGAYVKIKQKLTVYECGLCVWNDATERFDRHVVLWRRSDDGNEAPIFPEGHHVLWSDDSGAKWSLFGDPFPRLKCAATFDAWSDPDAWQMLQPQATVVARDGGQPIRPHRGSIAWNGFRDKWIAIFTQLHGQESALGEIWYAEAEQPIGPWGPAIRVVTHANYTFYNPLLHPAFTQVDSPVLLFEGTYTNQFANHAEATPRHDYNQVLYRLDLDDPALALE
ncbi:MAG: hypothetical protein AAF961_08405 [Planctomycetota bacterium]